jgi:hypothetical protein
MPPHPLSVLYLGDHTPVYAVQDAGFQPCMCVCYSPKPSPKGAVRRIFQTRQGRAVVDTTASSSE